MHRLRAEGLGFTTTAPKRWTFSAPVTARPAEVFAAISADPSTWKAWFPGLSAGHYEGDSPPGIGSGREVTVRGTRYRETVLVWDAPRLWAYRVDETTVPMAHALVEEWRVAPDGDGSVVSWTFAIDPRPLFTIAMPLAAPVMGASSAAPCATSAATWPADPRTPEELGYRSGTPVPRECCQGSSSPPHAASSVSHLSLRASTLACQLAAASLLG